MKKVTVLWKTSPGPLLSTLALAAALAVGLALAPKASRFLKRAAELPAIYAAIQDELRGKMLLAYQSKNTSTQDAFRTIEVKLDMPGVEVKAPRGYYP